MINKTNKDLDELSNKLISELVKYTETSAGAIFLASDSNPDQIEIVLAGSFCLDSDEIAGKAFLPGEGNIGTCFAEQKVLKLDDLPDGYMILSSGLGDTSLRNSVLVPIVNENISLGVMEVGSINTIESYKLEFISKLAENFASVIAISKANKKTSEMLEQNKVQSEELQAQEEELRQNLEEMQATQEESNRRIQKYEQVIAKKEKEISKLQNKLMKSK
jgi:hypothetical protein